MSMSTRLGNASMTQSVSTLASGRHSIYFDSVWKGQPWACRQDGTALLLNCGAFNGMSSRLLRSTAEWNRRNVS